MSAIASSPATHALVFTGERMVPNKSDIATELFHWQRYLYFRPWYEDKHVVDAASGEGYGLNYASNFTKSATGVEIAPDAVAHAAQKYDRCRFVQEDVCSYDYSSADLVISFETIEHLEDPAAFLQTLSACKGSILVSTPNRNTHSPGNSLEDKPFNQFHTIEWTPEEFASLIKEHFPTRQVRFLSQQATWPGTIKPGLDDAANYVIAVIGDEELPAWPRLGVAVPTINGSQRCRDLVANLTRFYPGEVEFAIVNNGSRADETAAYLQLQIDFPNHVHLLNLKKNVGYGRGANVGLDFLQKEQRFDLFVVSNDDVIPSIDCVPQLVSALSELSDGGQNPGVIGPVTNEISGKQKVDIGSYSNLAEMLDRSELYHRDNHSSATRVNQLRGLFMVITPKCLEAVGGFDPRFGLGNFEDDDHNLRCRCAGYSLWIADGAFLHHTGSTTFNELKIDYSANIDRNLQLIQEKWGMANFNEFLTIDKAPEKVSIKVGLEDASVSSGHFIELFGEAVDLIYQASDMEFAAYVFNSLQGKGRMAREAVIHALGS